MLSVFSSVSATGATFVSLNTMRFPPQWSCIIFLVEAPTSIYHFFLSSVHLFIGLTLAHHISGTVHHLIIILFTQVWNDNIFGFVFFFFLILVFQTVSGVKVQKMPKMKNNNYTCRMPYLRNSIAYDHDFWYTFVELWYLHALFFIFSKFWFSGLLGAKGQKMFQNE